MNEKIKYYQKLQSYPCFIYYYTYNSKFDTIAEAKDFEMPDTTLCDNSIPKKIYDYWAQLMNSKCKFIAHKFFVESFDEITKCKNEKGFVRYADMELNEYFGVDK